MSMGNSYVHIVKWNSDSWKRLLRFRDYLCQHKEAAREYANLKRELPRKSQGKRDSYTPGKAEFIESVLRMAEGEIHIDGL